MAKDYVDLRRGSVLDWAPGPMPDSFDFERAEGMMLGLAIGGALGDTTEGQMPGERRAVYGEIRDYLPNRHAGERAVGLPSDDTQLAFWTIERMLEDDGLVPERLARRFCCGGIFGIGSAVREFIARCKKNQPWYRCGPTSAGNGALMRIAPVLLPHLHTGSQELWADVVLAAMVTHNDAASTAACLAFVSILWQAMQLEGPPPADWWLAEYVRVARECEQGDYSSRSPAYPGYTGPLWRFIEEEVSRAYRDDLPVVEACNRWYSGAYLLETVPSVLYILMRHAGDLEEGIVRAVNDTKDNDTVAAIVGGALEALHGKQAIPQRWLAGLLGRTTGDDDGRVFELLAEARRAWWEGNAPS